MLGQSLLAAEPPNLIIHHARVITVDSHFTIAQAVAVRGGRIQAVGTNDAILNLKGTDTRLLDAGGRTLLPGLYDSHVHPVMAAASELKQPLPRLASLDEVFAAIRQQVKTT